MAPLVFLDVDGVLNSQTWLYSSEQQRLEVHYFGHEYLMMEPRAVELLNRLIEASGAEVVISSSWRHGFDPGQMQGFLDKRGFRGKVIGATPTWLGNGNCRGDEIQAYIDESAEGRGKATPNFGCPVPFVILDDDADMEHLMPKLVRTTWLDGLQEAHIEAALRHLEAR